VVERVGFVNYASAYVALGAVEKGIYVMHYVTRIDVLTSSSDAD
jgi:hypothetical protein